MKNRKTCKHKKTIKCGKMLRSGAIYQCRQCTECGYKFAAEMLEKSEEPAHTATNENVQGPSNNLVSEGGQYE